jgi:HlyD family type I secretion membrane fusion protein
MGALATLKHHAEVARAAWKEQNDTQRQLKTIGIAKRDELAFMPAAIEITETPVRPMGRAVVLSICAFTAIALTWASIGEMDIIATSQGKIIPSERVKMIQPLESGVVRAILVEDGQLVKKGDVLIELDPTGSEADREKLFQELTTARTELARLDALLTKSPIKNYAPPKEASNTLIELQKAYLVSQLQQQKAERATLQGEISRAKAEIRTTSAGVARLERKYDTVHQRVIANGKLVEKGILPKLKYSEMLEEQSDVAGELEVERQRLTESQAGLRSARAQYAQQDAAFIRDIHAERAEVRQRAGSIEQELVKAVERKRLLSLTAPVDGSVQQLDIHTIGGVVTPAQPLMQIVPAESKIEVEVKILNKDIGFVRPGQNAEIKVESFPFTKYGTIDGDVRQVYQDAVDDEQLGPIYPARVSMSRTTMLVDTNTVDLTPGMAVTVEIKTGKRKIIDYILAPLQEYQDEGLREQ